MSILYRFCKGLQRRALLVIAGGGGANILVMDRRGASRAGSAATNGIAMTDAVQPADLPRPVSEQLRRNPATFARTSSRDHLERRR